MGACDKETATEEDKNMEKQHESVSWSTFGGREAAGAGGYILESGETAFNWSRNRLWIKGLTCTE